VPVRLPRFARRVVAGVSEASHVGPEHDHPFTHDPALDKSHEALLDRALRVVEAAERVVVGVDRMHGHAEPWDDGEDFYAALPALRAALRGEPLTSDRTGPAASGSEGGTDHG